jgi:hypothetical protein
VAVSLATLPDIYGAERAALAEVERVSSMLDQNNPGTRLQVMGIEDQRAQVERQHTWLASFPEVSCGLAGASGWDPLKVAGCVVSAVRYYDLPREWEKTRLETDMYAQALAQADKGLPESYQASSAMKVAEWRFRGIQAADGGVIRLLGICSAPR